MVDAGWSARGVVEMPRLLERVFDVFSRSAQAIVCVTVEDIQAGRALGE